jgi:hypothetical protein
MKRSGVASWQCSTAGGQVTVSAGWVSMIVPLTVPIGAKPETTSRIWPRTWECQFVHAPGEPDQVDAHPRGCVAAWMTSQQTSPVN